MEVRFDDDALDELELDPKATAGYSGAIVRSYRKKMQLLRAAPDERSLYAMRSLRLERLKGSRSHQHSLRLNKQWRLIIEFETQSAAKVVVVKGIEDYH